MKVVEEGRGGHGVGAETDGGGKGGRRGHRVRVGRVGGQGPGGVAPGLKGVDRKVHKKNFFTEIKIAIKLFSNRKYRCNWKI